MITSTDNNLIKKVAKLADKKYRDEYDCFVVEGYRSVKDSLSKLEVEKILLSESAYKKYAGEFDCEVVSDKVFAKIASTESSQGVICVAKRKPTAQNFGELCLFLDEVRDPGNLGTILRTAAACGFNTVITKNCVDVYNPKVVRSSMSAISVLDFMEEGSRILEVLSGKGYSVLCADMDGESVFSDNFRAQSKKKVCLVVGNEANGVTDEVRSKATHIISLPMENGMESLNVAIAAAICMYQIKYDK